MRKAFGNFVTELAGKDKSVVLLIGDNGYGLFDEFKEKYPDRFFNIGICEQSMVGVASGMALMGLKPYVYTITPFLMERAFEQVKLDIDQQNVNVKLVGYADYPDQGPTHAEVITINTCPYLFTNMLCFFPISASDTERVLGLSYKSEKPTFISLKRG